MSDPTKQDVYTRLAYRWTGAVWGWADHVPDSGVIDVMGSVGAGKTALIEQMVRHLKQQTHRMVILNGDLATTIDQDRILQHGMEAIQVNTGKECHLDAALVRTVLDRLDLENIDLVNVENVGNLICPVDFPQVT